MLYFDMMRLSVLWSHQIKLLLFLVHTTFCYALQGTQPHIVFILADDLGFNDVGFRGSGQIPTPNIDALAYSGIILNNYYVTPICTPSRSALMTGKYPIHTGMQHRVIYGASQYALPLSEKILPQYLEELGYINHIVGKWHLGSWKLEYTPMQRGFHSHLGYWTGHQDYFDHTANEQNSWGLDMRRNFTVAYDLHGKYSTDIFADESVRIIKNHNTNQPLFLYLAHAAAHSGNPYEPLRAPDNEVKKFKHIEDFARQRYAAIVSKLDESVGDIVKALESKNMLNNSIIVFSTDNGGPAAGFNLNAASNFPLKGVKNTLWEGGIRGAALVWSPLLEKNSRVAGQLMQISDWLPTLLEAANYKRNLTNLDGVSLWQALSQDTPSPREEILHNIDDIYKNAAISVRQWKLIQGTTYEGQWDNWYGPSGRSMNYNQNLVMKSSVGQVLQQLGKLPSVDVMKSLRESATITCNNATKTSCNPLQSPCLFNVAEDPCEYENLANQFPNILQELQRKLNEYNATAVPPRFRPVEQRGDPKYWNYVFTNFGDYQ